MISLYAILIGFGIDLILGDPEGFPHPVVWMGRLIARLEDNLRTVFPPTEREERRAGGVLWILVAAVSTAARATPASSSRSTSLPTILPTARRAASSSPVFRAA